MSNPVTIKFKPDCRPYLKGGSTFDTITGYLEFVGITAEDNVSVVVSGTSIPVTDGHSGESRILSVTSRLGTDTLDDAAPQDILDAMQRIIFAAG